VQAVAGDERRVGAHLISDWADIDPCNASLGRGLRHDRVEVGDGGLLLGRNVSRTSAADAAAVAGG
jgi:hypothetical protein